MFCLANVRLKYHVKYGNQQQEWQLQHPNQLLKGGCLPCIFAKCHHTHAAAKTGQDQVTSCVSRLLQLRHCGVWVPAGCCLMPGLS